MAEILRWSFSQKEYKKTDPENNTWYLIGEISNNSNPSSGDIFKVGYLSKIEIQITNLGGLGWSFSGGGRGTTEYYIKIKFGNEKIYQSNTFSIESSSSNYKQTGTFTITENILASGSDAKWVLLEVYGRTTTSDDFYLCRDGGTITITCESSEGIFKYYTGSTWQNCSVNYYDGTKWVQTQPYYYNGEKWVPTGA